MEPHEKTRQLLGRLVVATLLALGFGLWVHWPWLWAEHQRLEPIYRALIWSGDAAAFIGLIWFWTRYCLLALPPPDTDSEPIVSRCLWLSLFAALWLDITITVLTAGQEQVGQEQAIEVQGAIIVGRPTMNGEKAYVTCRFWGEDQSWHESYHQIGLVDQPPPVRQAIQAGQFPLPTRIAYDPRWPARCWLVGFNNEENNRLHWMSASCILFQVLCNVMILALHYGTRNNRAGVVPLYNLIAPWGALTPFFLAALCKLLQGEF
jgi:hypothetical protein